MHAGNMKNELHIVHSFTGQVDALNDRICNMLLR